METVYGVAVKFDNEDNNFIIVSDGDGFMKKVGFSGESEDIIAGDYCKLGMEDSKILSAERLINLTQIEYDIITNLSYSNISFIKDEIKNAHPWPVPHRHTGTVDDPDLVGFSKSKVLNNHHKPLHIDNKNGERVDFASNWERDRGNWKHSESVYFFHYFFNSKKAWIVYRKP